MKKLLSSFVPGLLMALQAYAQAPSSDYLKTMNSYVQPAPQATQIMKYVDYPVNLFTGTPQIDIPIYTLGGNGISVPVSISYHAGGGIKIDELAGSIGLGFSLNAGGEITREIRGNPDEGAAGQGGFFNKPHPLSFYKNSFEQTAGSYTDFQLWVDVNVGFVDLEPDIFYFSFNGSSGKFVFDDSLNTFVCITDNRRLNISFDNSSKVWTIINDDGSKYVFSAKEFNSTQAHNFGPGANNGPAGSTETTSWKLTKIINADATDSIIFNYGSTLYSYYSSGSNIAYQSISGPSRPSVFSYSYNTVTGSGKLTNITGSRFKVDFIDEATNRLDLPQQKALSKIIIKNSQDVVQDIFVMYHSYYTRQASIGVTPGGSDLGNSLKLDSIREYGNSESNANPLTHSFKYNSLNLPRRLSFAKDFWGYANNNDHAATLAPTSYNGALNQTFPGADRSSDETMGKAGILEKLVLPTGGMVEFKYEPNTVGYPVGQATALNIVAGGKNRLILKQPMQTFNADYKDTFIVNQPPNASINFGQGGVFANITIDPQLPKDPALGYPSYNSTAGPYFELIKFADIPGTTPAGPPFGMLLQYDNVYNRHLPNGKYVMIAHTYTLNNSNILNDVRVMNFAVSFAQLDSTGLSNYRLCGLRVKSITTTDQYSNITNTRNFLYHNPETDSSYGKFIGTTLSNYIETGGSTQYLVRMGNNNMPGMGNAMSNVIYPKVIEDVTANGVTYRTEHNYSSNAFLYPRYDNGWPFAPPEDRENERGSEILTEWKTATSYGFTNAKRSQRIYDFNPHKYSAPKTYFSRVLYGIKCSNSSYDQANGDNTQYAPSFVAPYPIHVNDRTYLTSDSTITYDMSTPNKKITGWHDYAYGDKNQQPIIVRSGNSDGSVTVQKNWYAADQPEPSSEINATVAAQMVQANRVSQPLGTKTYKDNQLLSQQFTYGHFTGSRLLTDSMRQAIFSNPLETEIKVLAYDDAANPLSILLRGNKYRKYIWNKQQGLALATCMMPQDGAFFFTSFEHSEYPAGTINTAHFSGSYAYQLTGANNITLNGFNSSTGLEVYAWTTGAGFLVNSAPAVNTGITSGAWTLYKASPGAVTAVTISGNAMIDQLAVLPTGSSFEGNVYDPSGRIVSKVTNDMQTTFYGYDNFGRLSVVRDEQGNVIKSSSYQYQGGQ